MSINDYKIKAAVAVFIILMITSTVLFPTITHGFSNWDEDVFLTENPNVRELSWASVHKIFTSSNAMLFVPMVILSYAVEYHFFGMNPRVFHATNLILHLLNCILLFWLIFLLSKKVLVSFIVSILFGIHTLNVESIAWIVERKDVLFAFFYLGSLICYSYYRKKENKKSYYYFSLLLFILSLLSKVMAISLIFILFLLDFMIFKKEIKTFLTNHVPFYVISVLFYLVSLSVIARSDPAANSLNLPMANRILLLLCLIPFYIYKLILPVHLTARYSLHVGDLLPSPLWSVVIVPLAVATIVLFYAKKKDDVLFGSLFFLLTLLPVFPLVFMGYPYGDRYGYLPAIGIFYIFGWAFHYFFNLKSRFSRIARIGLVVFLMVMITALSLATRKRVRVWENNIRLWTDVIKNNPKEEIAYYNRGKAYIADKQPEKALLDFDMAIFLNPKDSEAYNNRGALFFHKKEYKKAFSDYNTAIQLHPMYAKAYFNRGTLWGHLRYYANAVNDYSVAIQLDPDFLMAYYYRAITFENLGNFADARNDYLKIYELDPSFAPAIERRNKLSKSGKRLKK